MDLLLGTPYGPIRGGGGGPPSQIITNFFATGGGFWLQNNVTTMIGVTTAGTETLDWRDQSGGNFHATQLTAGRGPLYGVADSIPFLQGRATITKLLNATFNPGTTYTITLGLIANTSADGSAVFGLGTALTNCWLGLSGGNWVTRNSAGTISLTLGSAAAPCVIQFRMNAGSCACYFNGSLIGTVTMDIANRTGYAVFGANSSSGSGSAGTHQHKLTGAICLAGVHDDAVLTEACNAYIAESTGIGWADGAPTTTALSEAQMQEVFVQQSTNRVQLFWKGNANPFDRSYIMARFDYGVSSAASDTSGLSSWSFNQQYKCTRVNETEVFTNLVLIDSGLSSTVLFDDNGDQWGGSAHGWESNVGAGEGATLLNNATPVAINGSTSANGETSASLEIISRFVEHADITQRAAAVTKKYTINGVTRTLTAEVSITPDRNINCDVLYPAMFGASPSLYTTAVWAGGTSVDLTDLSGGTAWGPHTGGSITLSGPTITTVFAQTSGVTTGGIRIGPNSQSRKCYPLRNVSGVMTATTEYAYVFTYLTSVD